MSNIKEKLLNMELHEEAEISGSLNIIRVPGGWIYKFFDEKEATNKRPTFQAAVFVPNPNDSFYQTNS